MKRRFAIWMVTAVCACLGLVSIARAADAPAEDAIVIVPLALIEQAVAVIETQRVQIEALERELARRRVAETKGCV